MLVRSILGASFFVFFVPLAGCSPSNGGNDGSGFGGGGGAGEGGSGGGSAGGGTGGSAGSVIDSGLTDSPVSNDGACVSVSEKATSTPLDLYVLLDKSSSMAGNKWTSAGAGLDAFLNDPMSSGIRVALNFFPLTVTPACDPANYKQPKVDFGALPGNAAAISAALSAESPNGFNTPIYPALAGALAKVLEVAKAAQLANQPESGAVLLVTDGQPDGPTSCTGVDPTSAAVIAQVAANALAQSPPVKTFVVGLPGVDQTFANAVAAAGGTGQVILVTNQNVQAEFQAALAKVRGEALPCEYDIPQKVADKTVSTDHVNVLYTPGGATSATTIPQSADCSSDGWYYDDPSNPTKIVLCPNECAAVQADYGAQIDIGLGCQTVLK